MGIIAAHEDLCLFLVFNFIALAVFTKVSRPLLDVHFRVSRDDVMSKISANILVDSLAEKIE